MHCKACNCRLSPDRVAKSKPDGSPEDMCSPCVGLAFDETPLHDYVHGSLTEDPIEIIMLKLNGELA